MGNNNIQNFHSFVRGETIESIEKRKSYENLIKLNNENENMPYTYLSDEPIGSIQRNLFFPEHYVYALTEFLNICETPITISLQGEWGSGKTSFMNMVKEYSESNNYPLYFYTLNAWQYSQFNYGEQLPLVMLKKLANDIDGNNKVHIYEKMKRLCASAINILTRNKIADYDTLNKVFDKDDIDKLATLKDGFQYAINDKLIKENKRRFIIFIDDLDRLEPEKALQVLESMKIFLDCQNSIFILAIDYNVIIKGASAKYGEDFAKSFFDKLVQLPFIMPTKNYHIDKYVESCLSIINDKNFDLKKRFDDCTRIDMYVKILENTIGTNPRIIKKIINSLFILYKMDLIKYKNAYGEDAVYDIEILDILFFKICLSAINEDLWYILYTDAGKLSDNNNDYVEQYVENLKNSNIFNDKIDVDRGNTLINIYCDILKNLSQIDNVKKSNLYTFFSYEK